MRHFALIVTMLALAQLPLAANAQSRRPGVASARDASAQAEPRARLRVYPGRRLLYRDCAFNLVQQWRPSGPVIVPWQHCWWVRG